MARRTAEAQIVAGGLVVALVAAAALVALGLRPNVVGNGSVKSARVTSPCSRPYTAASPWNSPIGSSPAIDAHSEAHVEALGGPLTSDPTQYTYPVYEIGPRARRLPVRVDGVFSDVTHRGRRLRVHKRPLLRLPIPAGAGAAAGTDAQIIMIDPRTGDEWGFWRARRAAGGWRVQNGYHYNVRWTGVPPRSELDEPFGSRGAGVTYLAGLVRPCEIARGRIGHALAFAYDYPTSERRYPAAKSDGRSRDPADLPEGTRLQLDPQLSRADLLRLGCMGACLTIAKALQIYGMYVIDNSGRPKVMMEYEETARWQGLVDADTVSPIPMLDFRVLDAH